MLLALGGALSSACADATQMSAAPLCEGQAGVRLRAGVAIPIGQDVLGGELRDQHGILSLVVDGKCEAWVNAGWVAEDDRFYRDREWRTGHLTEEQKTALETALPLHDLTKLQDCVPLDPSIDHPSVRQLLTGVSGANCATSGTRFDKAWNVVSSVARQVYTTGKPMDGPLWTVGRPIDDTQYPPPYEWPLTRSLSDLLKEFSQKGAVAVPDQQAKALRELRDLFNRERATRTFAWDGLNVKQEMTKGTIFLRDAIPYEDGNGRLPF